MRSERRESMGHRDSGAVAVETALVAMLLVTLLYGVVEASFLFKDWISVSAAARAGSRMGASEPRVGTGANTAQFAQDAANQVTNALSDLNPANIQEVWVYRTTSATGLPDSGSFASCTTCVKFTWSAGSPGSLTKSYNGWSYLSQNACAGDPGHDSIGLYLKYKHTSPLRFFFNNTMLSETTVMSLEPITTNTTCK